MQETMTYGFGMSSNDIKVYTKFHEKCLACFTNKHTHTQHGDVTEFILTFKKVK